MYKLVLAALILALPLAVSGQDTKQEIAELKIQLIAKRNEAAQAKQALLETQAKILAQEQQQIKVDFAALVEELGTLFECGEPGYNVQQRKCNAPKEEEKK